MEYFIFGTLETKDAYETMSPRKGKRGKVQEGENVYAMVLEKGSANRPLEGLW